MLPAGTIFNAALSHKPMLVGSDDCRKNSAKASSKDAGWYFVENFLAYSRAGNLREC